MSQRDKLLEKVRRRPKSVTFEELDRLLRAYGYELVRVKGSHCAYRRPGAPPITVARHKPHVHSHAVKDVLRAIDELLVSD
jgi:predicted RNA binding protein YcfA (HicA-like mRNA interferase family)